GRVCRQAANRVETCAGGGSAIARVAACGSSDHRERAFGIDLVYEIIIHGGEVEVACRIRRHSVYRSDGRTHRRSRPRGWHPFRTEVGGDDAGLCQADCGKERRSEYPDEEIRFEAAAPGEEHGVNGTPVRFRTSRRPG